MAAALSYPLELLAEYMGFHLRPVKRIQGNSARVVLVVSGTENVDQQEKDRSEHAELA